MLQTRCLYSPAAKGCVTLGFPVEGFHMAIYTLIHLAVVKSCEKTRPVAQQFL
jgi:hypothetical protein